MPEIKAWSVGGQMRGVNELNASSGDVTNYGKIRKKVPEIKAWSADGQMRGVNEFSASSAA